MSIVWPMVVGGLALVGMGVISFGIYKRLKPSADTIERLEAFFEGNGRVVWILRLPIDLGPARAGQRSYWVRIITPLGFSRSHVVAVSGANEAVRLVL